MSAFRAGSPQRPPGIEDGLAWLQSRVDEARRTGRGEVVFVAGDSGAGHTELVHAFLQRNRGTLPLLGSVRGIEPASTSHLRTSWIVERITSLAGPVGDILGRLQLGGLIEQLVSASAANLQTAQRAAADSKRLTLPEVEQMTRRMLRSLCEDGPAAWIVDDADASGSAWWNDWVGLFARHIARDLPLVVIVTVVGPEHLGPHQEDESDALFVARQLVLEGLACWHPISTVEAAQLRAWTGPASPGVIETLLRLTGGRASWIARLWSDWRQVHLIEAGPDGWTFAANGRGYLSDPAQAEIARRLTPFIVDGDTSRLRLARFLGVAAKEGRRFTLDAVAAALHLELNETIDWLDATAVRDSRRPDGLLEEHREVPLSDGRQRWHVWRYEFGSDLDWYLFRHHGLQPAEAEDIAPKLAAALSHCYRGQVHLVADSLVALYREAGDHDKAVAIRQDAARGASRELALWRARMIVEDPNLVGRLAQERAIQVLLFAADLLVASGPYQEGVDFATTALRLNPSARSEAAAKRTIGCLYTMQGKYGDARETFDEAWRLYETLEDRAGAAYTQLSRGALEFYACDSPLAARILEPLPQAFENLGDRNAESQARNWLATCLLEVDPRRAREEHTEALTLATLVDDTHEAALAHKGLGVLAEQRKDYGSARDEYVQALTMERQLGRGCPVKCVGG